MRAVRLQPSHSCAADCRTERDRRGDITCPMLVFINAIPPDESYQRKRDHRNRQGVRLLRDGFGNRCDVGDVPGRE